MVSLASLLDAIRISSHACYHKIHLWLHANECTCEYTYEHTNECTCEYTYEYTYKYTCGYTCAYTCEYNYEYAASNVATRSI